MTYYLKEKTKEEAIKNITEIIDYYYENADMSLEFNQAGLFLKIACIISQLKDNESRKYTRNIIEQILDKKRA